ncbi:hypothetical protein KFL_003280020 [Klebsormidium nitens]|uniref:S-acyltransferase n=1 Tax=Klebsormidium nitens TaxID=105231 RepID=A0A1Y1IG14_KLENI|nr:hypothetical protein KFL_003280020 [Klebsormidium nitens]|eukprot:GAQ87048.1 hypothetical protein KFL_003280020 [Klebsormidium nitens]
MALTPSRLLSITVCLVLSAYAFVCYTTVQLVIFPSMGPELTTPLVLHLSAFSAIALLGIVSYAAAVMIDPGSVPPGWMPDAEENNDMAVQEVKSDGGARFCSKCQAYKPPRCHHCRICKACVLRMDHHCVWIANCVGQHNYHPFFLFVLYFLVGCAYALYLLINQLLQDIDSLEDTASEAQERDRRRLPHQSFEISWDSLYRIFTAILVLPLAIGLGVLFCWHVYLVLHNKTTIEYHEGVRARWLAKKKGQLYKHPYDLGIVRNLITIFGPNATSWFWPTLQSPGGDGLSFRTYLHLSTETDRSVGLDEEVRLETRTDDDDFISLGHKPVIH